MDHITLEPARPNRCAGPTGAQVPDGRAGRRVELRRCDSQNSPGDAASRYPDTMLG
jgi:hypothetical protein